MKKKIIIFVIFAIILGGLGSLAYIQKNNPVEINNGDIYTKFILEVFDSVKENYWRKINDGELEELYLLAMTKMLEKPIEIEVKNRENLEKTVKENMDSFDSNKKKEEFSVVLSDLVLQNLAPVGKSRLYTRKDETILANQVNNINPDKNLYNDLGLEEGATEEEVQKKYDEKAEELKNDNSPEAQEKLKEIEYAHKVLTDSVKKELYDEAKVEPTIYSKIISPNILHVHLQKFSPITFNEFQTELDKLNGNKSLDTLILDLRDNIGGAIDILPHFLGFFIGKGQYAYEFFHQDENTPYKTQLDKLPSLKKYKKVIILSNNKTQSTAELMISVLKKYNFGVIVGEKTNGWGSIERVFELDTRISETEIYSLFLVHTLTLSDTNQPIESNGVEPNIVMSSSDWKKEFLSYFDSNNLANVVEKIWKTNPNDYY